MTDIENFESYKTFPDIYCLDENFNFVEIGVYDPDWGTGDIEGYQPGKFTDYKGDTTYDDTMYKGKKCMTFYFKHKPLGNYPGLKRIGYGHKHIKYVVSTNTISPQDVAIRSTSGDILLFATLKRFPPISVIWDDGTMETLYEVEPHLNSAELTGLIKSIDFNNRSRDAVISNIQFVTKIKEKYMQAMNRTHELEAENFLVNSRALANEMTVLLLQETTNSLIKKQNMLMDKFVKLSLHNREVLVQGISEIEGNYNTGVSWDMVVMEDSEKTMASIQADIRAIEAMTRNNSLTENQKQIICQMTVNTVGLDYLRRYIGGVQQYRVDTPIGPQSVTMQQNPSFAAKLLEYTRMRDDGRVSPQQYLELVKDMIEKEKADINNGDGKSPNSAVEQIKEKLGLPSGGNVGTEQPQH